MEKMFKQVLTRIGECISMRTIHTLNASINYLEVGRWMRSRGYQPTYRLADKNEFWQLLGRQIGNRVVLYLEFGVWQGETTRAVANHLKNPQSRFHGFDSFEGLPESWNMSADAGCFSTNGRVPHIDDPRVQFHKGWFQETLPGFVLPPYEVLVINLDADLYSSTAFALDCLRDAIVPGTYLYFDEFSDRHHELRAFDEFLRRTEVKVDLVAAAPTFDKVLFRCFDGFARGCSGSS